MHNIKTPPELFTTHFKCNLDVCKGACCISKFGGGAPLEINEIEKIKNNLDIFKTILPTNIIDFIDEKGFFDNFRNSFTTKCLPNGQCVFVYFENEIAFCSIEKLFKSNLIDFNKPISCQLFPVRLKNFNTEIEFEFFNECDSAFENGKNNNVFLNDFLKDSLNIFLNKNNQNENV